MFLQGAKVTPSRHLNQTRLTGLAITVTVTRFHRPEAIRRHRTQTVSREFAGRVPGQRAPRRGGSKCSGSGYFGGQAQLDCNI
jgi:hypothetical protein